LSRVHEATSFRSIFGKLLYRFTKRKVIKRLGKEIEPVQVLSNHPKLLWGYLQLSQALDGDGLLDSKLKSLICARVASHIGCLF
jgi:hypothetical protein